MDSRCRQNYSQVCYDFFDNLLILDSSIVVENLQMKFEGIDDVAVPFVYFSYNDPEAITSTDIIPNLLKQLWERTLNMSEEAQKLYSSHQRMGTKPNIKALSQVLRTECDRVSTFFSSGCAR